MAKLQRHRRGHRPLVLVLCLLAPAAVAVFAGCGEGDGGATGRTSTAATAVGEGANGDADQPQTSKAKSNGKAKSSRQGGEKDIAKTGVKGDRGQSRHSGNRTGDADSHPSGHCPSNISREQCRAYAEQPVSDKPSYTAKDPGDCRKAMSREQCEERFEAEQESQEQAGQSVGIDHCLEERTRAECEEQLGAQLEAEREGSKGD